MLTFIKLLDNIISHFALGWVLGQLAFDHRHAGLRSRILGKLRALRNTITAKIQAVLKKIGGLLDGEQS